MKNIFKLLILSLISTFLFNNVFLMSSNADTIDTGDTTVNLFDELLELNDPNLNNYLKDVNTNSSNLTTNEFYLKVYETESDTIIDDKIYTPSEYLLESSIMPLATITPVNWIKFVYQISPIIPTTTADMIVSYEWMSVPKTQGNDIFTVSTNSTAVLPGSNSLVWYSFWPNKNCSKAVGLYNNFDNPSYYNFSDINGFSVKHKIKTTDTQSSLFSKINNLPTSEKNSNFYLTAQTSVTSYGYETRGCPKGTVMFKLKSPTNNPSTSKVLFTYNHSQFLVDLYPNISIDSSGSVNLGITAGMNYNSVSSSIDYTWGKTVN